MYWTSVQWLIRELGLTRQSFGGKAVMLDFVKIRNTLNACTCCNRHLAWVGLDDEPPPPQHVKGT